MDSRHPQLGAALGDVGDRAQAGDEPAGKDVLLDPAVGAPRHEVAVVGHEDRLDRRDPARREEAVDGAEVGGPVLLADRLDHLDRDDRVVAAACLAVVLEADVDAVRDAGGRGAVAGQGRLLAGERQGRHVSPPAGRLDREGPPARADLEDGGAVADACLVEDRVDLAQLGVLERLPLERGRPVEESRAVRQCLVEEGGEEVVGQVVVRLDVAAGPRQRVALVVRDGAVDDLPEGDPPAWDRRREPRGEGSQHVREVGARRGAPVAGHVGLADADLRVVGEALEEG